MSEEFVIWSIEHDRWWRPGEMGYCDTLAEAGRYPRERADQIVARANVVTFHECRIPIRAIAGANLLLAQLPSITCPHCGSTSYNPMDIAHKFCGCCDRFHDDPPESAR